MNFRLLPLLLCCLFIMVGQTNAQNTPLGTPATQNPDGTTNVPGSPAACSPGSNIYSIDHEDATLGFYPGGFCVTTDLQNNGTTPITVTGTPTGAGIGDVDNIVVDGGRINYSTTDGGNLDATYNFCAPVTNPYVFIGDLETFTTINFFDCSGNPVAINLMNGQSRFAVSGNSALITGTTSTNQDGYVQVPGTYSCLIINIDNPAPFTLDVIQIAVGACFADPPSNAVATCPFDLMLWKKDDYCEPVYRDVNGVIWEKDQNNNNVASLGDALWTNNPICGTLELLEEDCAIQDNNCQPMFECEANPVDVTFREPMGSGCLYSTYWYDITDFQINDTDPGNQWSAIFSNTDAFGLPAHPNTPTTAAENCGLDWLGDNEGDIDFDDEAGGANEDEQLQMDGWLFIAPQVECVQFRVGSSATDHSVGLFLGPDLNNMTLVTQENDEQAGGANNANGVTGSYCIPAGVSTTMDDCGWKILRVRIYAHDDDTAYDPAIDWSFNGGLTWDVVEEQWFVAATSAADNTPPATIATTDVGTNQAVEDMNGKLWDLAGSCDQTPTSFFAPNVPNGNNAEEGDHLSLIPYCYEISDNANINCTFCCMFSVACPNNTDLGDYDCSQLGSIPAAPFDEASAEAAPYNITIGDMPCGTIVVQSSDDINPPYDVCAMGGQTVTRTVTVFDDLNGNGAIDAGEESQVCTFTFDIIEDTTPPVAPNPPAPVTVQCATDIPAPVSLTATDNCSGDITVSPTAVMDPGACANQFTMTRTWTFTDACGNPSSVSQVITVFDNTPPILSATPGNLLVECDAVPAAPTITAMDNCAFTPPVLFINEINYDNTGTDVGEFLEIAGTAGINLSDYEVYAYENFDGQFDAQVTLSGIIPDEGAGFGAVAFTRTELPTGFFENGPADGIALVEIATGDVIQFISYEGTCTASNGPAAGQTSINIGGEPSNDPIGQSLQLTGIGCPLVDFSWNPPAPESPGLINAGQTFDGSECFTTNDVFVSFTETVVDGACADERTITRTWTATDECGNTASHTQTISVVDNTAPTFCNPPADITLTCELPGDANILAVDNCNGGNPIVWINEIHYDNTGTDVGEFIEIAGVAGTDLSMFELSAYEGSDGNVDATITLSGVIPDENGCGYGAVAFFLGDLNSQFFENGPREGRALTMGSTVVHFMSYEGPVTANNGPAAGAVATDVGVSELFNTPVGQSIQASGPGGSALEFTWTGPLTDSPGTLNAGQIITSAPGIDVVLEENGTVDACVGGVVTRTWTATDACGNASAPYTQTITVLPAPGPMITCPADITVSCEDEIMLDPNDATATPGCPDGSIVSIYIKNPDAMGAPGCNGTEYVYTYVAVDDCGNQATCTQTVTIENTPATISVPAGGTVTCLEDIDISVNDATVENVCADFNLYLAPVTINGEVGCPGTTYTYTYRVVDVCGNTIEEDVVFTNGANDGPTIEAPVDITCECFAGVNPNPDLATVTTACGNGVDFNVDVSGPQIIGAQDCPGTRYIYTYTVTDACGRTASDQQTFTINNGPPVFQNCPDDNWLVLNCEDYGGEEGTIDVIEAWIASVTATTSCGEPLTVFNNFNSNNIGTCINDGYTTVTFRATDNCGRTTFCTGTVVVIDTEAPKIVEEAQDHYEVCNYLTQENLDDWVDANGGALAYDGCSNEQVFWSTIPNNPTINCMGQMGTTEVTVTFVVRDNCGNKTETTATFYALMGTTDLVQDEGPADLNNEVSGLTLDQNRPNPFKNETVISFNLPKDMEGSMVIYDVSGRVLRTYQGDFIEGYNEIVVQQSDLAATGILFYQLITEEGTITRKMIISK